MYDLKFEWYESEQHPEIRDALFAVCPKCGYRACGKWPRKRGEPNNFHCIGCGTRYARQEDGTYEPLALTKLELILHVAP